MTKHLQVIDINRNDAQSIQWITNKIKLCYYKCHMHGYAFGEFLYVHFDHFSHIYLYIFMYGKSTNIDKWQSNNLIDDHVKVDLLQFNELWFITIVAVIAILIHYSCRSLRPQIGIPIRKWIPFNVTMPTNKYYVR